MHIWQMDPDSCGDRRLPHHIFPPKMLAPDQLLTIFGIAYYKVDIDDTVALKKRLSRVKKERQVSGSDVFTIGETLTSDFSAKLDELFEPTTKTDDVIALVIDGSAYYDVERDEENWIRVQVEKGDLIVIPAGVTHRFTTTPQNYVKIQRFFPSSESKQDEQF